MLVGMYTYICVSLCLCRRAYVCILLSHATVCTSIQVAGLSSLSTNQVEHLNQDPTMHVDSLLCANEVGNDGGVGEERERSNP